MTRLRVTSAAIVLIGCTPATEICTPWADAKLAYTVELLEPAPVDDWAHDTFRCGDSRVRFETGDTVAMRVKAVGQPGPTNRCRRGELIVDLPDLDRTPAVASLFQIDSREESLRVTTGLKLDGPCEGSLRLAITRYPKPTGQSAPGASDWVFHRVIDLNDPNCRGEGFVPPDTDQCWDAWFVRITDENGVVVTKHPDAGL